MGILPASTSARMAFCAAYSLLTMPALDCSMRHDFAALDAEHD